MYAELHAISNYSFLRGASHPHELVAEAARLGYSAIAITDECSVAGVVKAHMAAVEAGIALIVGSEFRLPEGTFVLLATSRAGYGALCRLISRGRRRAPKGEYRINLDDLLSPLPDCVLLWRPPMPQNPGADIAATERQWFATQKRLAKQLAAWQGRRYFLAEQCLEAAGSLWQRYLKRLSDLCDIPCVAAGDVRMHSAARQPLLDVLTCIRLGLRLDEAEGHLCQNAEHYLRPLGSIHRRYPQEWIANTQKIASQCRFSMAELRYEYPAELVPAGLNASEYLAREVAKGARRRYGLAVPAAVKRQYLAELKLIHELEYEYFFLTIYDIVRFARRKRILHQGRGSAANSVVCFCLGITEVDPTRVNMLFERFISKERHEPPDIDVDFEHERREEVIQYIYRKYGRHRAALAASVITYRLKSAMGEVGKVLGLDRELVARLIQGIDRRDPSHPWREQLAAQLPGADMFGYLVQSLLGFPRHLSQHVGGFVISAGPLAELVPVENAAMEDRTVIQWDKDDLEALGLLKVDVLALGMLTAIRKCFELISRHQQSFGMRSIKAEDPNVYRMLSRGDSMGVFQVESRAQTSMLPRLRPACYYDLVIQIAIVRPGPIQGDMVHPFLRRRKGLEAVTYPSEAVKAVLERTMGVPIFQEQVIKLAMVAAGFSGGEADALRRAMASWKHTGKLWPFEQKLLDGMAARGYSEDFARQIFRQIQGFGEYGFPESHSASFALLAYVSAYLKFYYPAAFCCALLNSQPMGFYSPSQLLQDVRRHGVEVFDVCINHSQWDSSLVKTATGFGIRLGFRQVKGLKEQAMQRLVAARPAAGFAHLSEVSVLLDRHALELLAAADAFRLLSGHRFQSRWQLSARQASLPLFDDLPEPLLPGGAEPSLSAPNAVQCLKADYRSKGLSLGQHPMALLRTAGLLGKTLTAKALEDTRHGQLVTVAGVVTGRQRPGTASGVTFITLEDETGNTNLIVWMGTARAQRKPYLTSTILKVNGTVEHADGVTHVVAGRLEDISHLLDSLKVASRDFH
ncbi:error-prone DNA polymerase [Shewanella sp. FJAT-52076]|uniref:error-prone DNA polymerase n=1 Tax=Shewanella sp. FJAT-52076 TaxID=2864202 RepID=UPI001C65FF10|nr:error-prone DNA polymerase [Shewanella sp. FJAT-52076]QYJ73671.1 error-prone DNA polymerase [Shewanella sp. FJAT-52076]